MKFLDQVKIFIKQAMVDLALQVLEEKNLLNLEDQMVVMAVKEAQ
tara:strand:+ start:834 stop:968 length:135 start_codon:yes stop_codon:yes gene_type:complete